MTPQPPNSINIASLVRLASDDELSPEQHVAFKAHFKANPRDQDHVAFERSLRQAVSRSMQGEGAPADLAARVRAALDESALAQSADNDRQESEVPLVETIAHATRDRSFWASLGGRLAVAAALLLVVSGVWYSFTQLSPRPINNWSDVNRIQLASFLTEQHMMCGSDPDYADHKFSVSEVNGIDASCLRLIQQTPELEQLFEQGGKLVGIGKCGVPGPGKSVHMQVLLPLAVNSQTQIRGQTTVSLFIQQSLDRDGIDPETSYSLDQGTSQGYVVDVWQRDGLIYYLVCDTPEAAAVARRTLNVAAPNQNL